VIQDHLPPARFSIASQSSEKPLREGRSIVRARPLGILVARSPRSSSSGMDRDDFAIPPPLGSPLGSPYAGGKDTSYRLLQPTRFTSTLRAVRAPEWARCSRAQSFVAASRALAQLPAARRIRRSFTAERSAEAPKPREDSEETRGPPSPAIPPQVEGAFDGATSSFDPVHHRSSRKSLAHPLRDATSPRRYRPRATLTT